MTSTCRLSVSCICCLVAGSMLGAQGCGGSSNGGSGDAGQPSGSDGSTVVMATGGVVGTGGGPGGVGGTTTARGSGGIVGTGGGGLGGAAGATTVSGGGGFIGTGGAGAGGVDGGVLGGTDGSTLPVCGPPGYPCCAGNTCTGGCCLDGWCLVSSACAGPADGSQMDAPLGGSGGNPGTGGVSGSGGNPGTGGVSGSGGGTATTVPTGGTGGTTTPWTVPAGCGDGVVTPPERCDDGNTMPFDGCSSDCQWEPDCSGSTCTSKCGDGIVLGEECDDGNTADGDGCSSSCKVEPGYSCAQRALTDKILVPVVYRDFKFHNPSDFEGGVTGLYSASTGMVQLNLDAEGKPVYANLVEPSANVHVESVTTFATWYRNTEQVNHANPTKLALWDNHNGAYVNRYGANGEQWPLTQTAMWCGSVGSEALDGSGNPIPCTYAYSSSTGQTDCDKLAAQSLTMLGCTTDSTGSTYRGIFLLQYVDGNPLFFPVDDDAFSSSEKRYAQIPSEPKGMYDSTGTWPKDVDVSGKDILHNFSFTSEIHYWFRYEADASYTLEVVGDDDVWVFVNKKLAVDVGGIHTPVAGSVTLDGTTASTYGLKPGNVYEVAVFQAERQSTSSTFKLTLAGFNLAPSECHPS